MLLPVRDLLKGFVKFAPKITCDLARLLPTLRVNVQMPLLRHRKIRTAFALFTLALWLGSVALAAFPTRHALAHANAGDRDHHCVVTQIQGHTLLAAPAHTVAPAAPATQVGALPLPSVPLLPRPDFRLEPNRGPPSAVVSSQVVG